uniref:Uncharacterized protein n=1 Tax=viral metagenome TaxID=1070528 RepID=A0A6C0FHB9_9ZZZZ
MEETKKYLWMNLCDQSIQDIYVYLNEKGKEIRGNTITDSSTESPYSVNSIYYNPDNVCKGRAVKYIRTIKNSLLKRN